MPGLSGICSEDEGGREHLNKSPGQPNVETDQAVSVGNVCVMFDQIKQAAAQF